jgi:hypothetical protein
MIVAAAFAFAHQYDRNTSKIDLLCNFLEDTSDSDHLIEKEREFQNFLQDRDSRGIGVYWDVDPDAELV